MKTTIASQNCTYKFSPLLIFITPPKKNAGDRQQIQQNTEIPNPTFDCTSRCIGVRNVTPQKRSHAAEEGGHLQEGKVVEITIIYGGFWDTPWKINGF